jgi:uncharacterized protein (TIGR03083 family)
MIGPDEQLAILDGQVTTLVELAGGDLSLPVPTCPDWTVGDLMTHVTGVLWRVKARASLEDASARFDPADTPVTPGAIPMAEWLGAQAAETQAFFHSADLDRPVRTFAGPGTVGWWLRRVVLELAVHITDAQLALGRDVPVVPAEVAVMGIDESLREFLPLQVTGAGQNAPTGTIHLHCTDVDGEWLVRLTPASDPGDGEAAVVAEVTAEHAKGDVAARGSASDLYLSLWGRPVAEQPAVFGDADLWHRLRAITGV